MGGGVTNYSINTFKVTATSRSGITSSTIFTESMPTQGFKYDGTSATQFWRLNGTYTNGATFYNPSTVGWGFNPNSFVIMNFSTYTSFVNIPSLSITLDSSGAACSPPSSPTNAPIDLHFSKQVESYSTEIELK